MARLACDGLVASLQGHLVMLTGRTRIGGEHFERRTLTRHLVAHGAQVLQDGTRNRRVTLLVLGDLAPERVTDPVNVRSKKVVFVDTQRRQGNHICVVDDGGISDLLQGRQAVCLDSRISAPEAVELRRARGFSALGTELRLRNHSGCGWGPGVSGDGVAEPGQDGRTVFAHGGDVATDPEPCLGTTVGAVAAGDLARRADTLALARESDPIPVSEPVMAAWARLVVDCRRVGVHRTVRLTDALIAATAVVHGLPVVTQDEDFDQIATAHPLLRVIRV